MRRSITFAVDSSGLVYSRVDSEIAVPVLQYEAIGRDGDFTAPLTYELEAFSVLEIPAGDWNDLRWTRRIPAAAKAEHRGFWGFPPL